MKWCQYNIQKLSDTEYLKWYSLMSKDKQQRVDRFRFEDDRKRTVVGEMLARQAISEWCGVSLENISFGIKEHGKPYAKDLAVEFNISHSGDTVVCAVDDKPVGIDIEQIRPVDLTVAKRICTDEELLYLFGHTPTDEDFIYSTDTGILTRFFELWTAKEAYGKCVGDGIASLELESNNNVSRYNIRDYIISIFTEDVL